MFTWYSLAGILNGDLNHIGKIRIINVMKYISKDNQFPTLGHGVNGIDKQIDEYLFNLISINIRGTIFTIKDGNVGINISTPTERLHVNGNALIDGLLDTKSINSGIGTFTTIKTTYLIDSNNSPGNPNQVLSSTPSGVLWIDKGIGGSWTDNVSTKTYNVTYANNTGSLLYVSATPGIDRDSNGLTAGQIAGSYAIAEVDGIEVARTRDNGTANTEFLFLNVKFFVPNGSEYVVKVYDTTGTQWVSSITTYSWSEFKFI